MSTAEVLTLYPSMADVWEWDGQPAGLPAGVLGFVPAQPMRALPVAERVVIQHDLDPYLSLKALAEYSGISKRKLHEYLYDTANPLPCFRPGGKILVRRSEFDAWIEHYRTRGRPDVAAALREMGLDRMDVQPYSTTPGVAGPEARCPTKSASK